MNQNREGESRAGDPDGPGGPPGRAPIMPDAQGVAEPTEATVAYTPDDLDPGATVEASRELRSAWVTPGPIVGGRPLGPGGSPSGDGSGAGADQATAAFSDEAGRAGLEETLPVFALDARRGGGDRATAITERADPSSPNAHRRGVRTDGRAEGAPLPAIPGYEIESELGRGGMGVVYRARQVALGRTVAIKMVLSGANAGPEQLARFYTEAQAIAHLHHPDIVQIYEIGEHDGLPYFSLEFLEGGSLAQRTGGRPMPPRSAATTLVTLAGAMHAAHLKGVIHRDLKPANILLTKDDQPKISDFGLAKRLEGDSQQTRTGAIMGTPSYMAPEQARGQTHEVGPLADQYALGAILYELLTGRPPFQGATPLETLELARTQEPVPPTRLQPKVPRDLETICLKALQKEPRKRYEDAGALADDLRRFLDGEPILARPVSAPERAWRWCRRNPRVAALAASLALSMVLATAISTVAAAKLADKNRQLDEKNRQLDRALATAREGRQRAEAAEAVALDQKAKSEAIAQLALKQSDFSLNSLRFLSVLANQRLRNIPNTQEVRAELLLTAERDLNGAMEEMDRVSEKAREYKIGNAALLQQTAVGIHMKTGHAFEEMGRLAEAGKQFAIMNEGAEALAAASPDDPEARQVLAYSKMALGDFLLTRAGKVREAEREYLRALDVRRELLARNRTDNRRRDLAQTLGALGRACLYNGDPSRAHTYLEEELALRDSLGDELQQDLEMRRERAGLLEKLGETCIRLGKPARGREYFDQSLELREELSRQTEGLPDAGQTTHRDVLLSLNRIGEMNLLQWNDPATARIYYQRALDAFRRLADDDPKNAVLQGDLAMAHYYVATACLRAGDRAESDRHYRACLEQRRDLLARAGGGDQRIPRINLMVALARCGEHEEASRLAAWLIETPTTNPHDYFQAACGFALSAGAVARDKPAGRRTPEEAALVRRYTDAAIGALRRGRAAGWRSLADIEIDPDLDPIRSDAGFAALLDEFRRAAAPSPPKG